MPRVGRKHFPYTPAGYRAARAEARRTGQPVEDTKRPARPVRRGRK